MPIDSKTQRWLSGIATPSTEIATVNHSMVLNHLEVYSIFCCLANLLSLVCFRFVFISYYHCDPVHFNLMFFVLTIKTGIGLNSSTPIESRKEAQEVYVSIIVCVCLDG